MKGIRFLIFFVRLSLVVSFFVNPIYGSETVDRLFRISGGYGVPYGYIGINFEINPLLPKNLHHINNYYSFSLGVGYKHKAPLFAMGINGYPLGRNKMVTPRLSFYYAKFDRILDTNNTLEKDYDTVEALCCGTGIVLQLTDGFSLNGDVFYLAYIYDEVDPEIVNGRFKFALGAQFAIESPYTTQSNESSFLNAGIGLGIPYGGIGVSLEMNPLLPGSFGQAIHNYFSVSIGSGFSSAGSAYSIGARFYPIGKARKYRPRAGFYYGTVAVLTERSEDFNLEGLALSAGVLFKINDQLEVDGDFVYIAHVFGGWDLDSLFKVSFGIRYLLKEK